MYPLGGKLQAPGVGVGVPGIGVGVDVGAGLIPHLLYIPQLESKYDFPLQHVSPSVNLTHDPSFIQGFNLQHTYPPVTHLPPTIVPLASQSPSSTHLFGDAQRKGVGVGVGVGVDVGAGLIPHLLYIPQLESKYDFPLQHVSPSVNLTHDPSFIQAGVGVGLQQIS
jgi:hypothetical protein